MMALARFQQLQLASVEPTS